MNNSIIIRLPVLQKAVETKLTTPAMPTLQFSLLVNNNQLKTNIAPEITAKEEETESPVPAADDSSLHQIEKSELPLLETPPLPSWLKTLNPPQFTCPECGDAFLYESNLESHMSRRSVLIKFPCTPCRTSLTYFNRCSLLAHVRLHSTDLEKATVVPLEKESLLASSDQKGEARTQQGVKGRLRCSECFEFFGSLQGRQEHFSSFKPGSASYYACAKCTVVCPTKCSLEAHHRIHLRIHPFVCPECGRDESDWDLFQTHLDRVCFHYQRKLGYKCMLCDQLEIDSAQPHKHFMAAHSEAYYKCQACPMAFKGPTSFGNHKKSAHPNGEVACKTIFKCPLCDTVFHGRDQLIGHLNVEILKYLKEEKVQLQPIFCCPQCSARYKTLPLLKEHFLQQHRNHSTDNEEDQKLETIGDSDEDESCVECKKCHQKFQSKIGYTIHVARKHCRRGFKCEPCGVTLADLKALYDHEKRSHLQKGEHVCMLCHLYRPESESDLADHLQRHVNRFKFPYTCSVCEVSLADYKETLEHVIQEHSPQQHPQLINNNNNNRSRNKHQRPNHLPPIKIRIPLQLVRRHSSEDGGSTSPTPPFRTYCVPTKKLRMHGDTGGSYICAKCDFQTQDRKEFQTHIQFHRVNASSLQCPDCGTCFVVENTLRKHLKVWHRVADIDTYLEQSGFGGPQNGRKRPESEESGPQKSNSCTICYQNFETESALKSHLRSHGMAFIRSRTAHS